MIQLYIANAIRPESIPISSPKIVKIQKMADYKNTTTEYKMGVGRLLVAKTKDDVYNITIFEMASEFEKRIFPSVLVDVYSRHVRDRQRSYRITDQPAA